MKPKCHNASLPAQPPDLGVLLAIDEPPSVLVPRPEQNIAFRFAIHRKSAVQVRQRAASSAQFLPSQQLLAQAS